MSVPQSASFSYPSLCLAYNERLLQCKGRARLHTAKPPPPPPLLVSPTPPSSSFCSAGTGRPSVAYPVTLQYLSHSFRLHHPYSVSARPQPSFSSSSFSFLCSTTQGRKEDLCPKCAAAPTPCGLPLSFPLCLDDRKSLIDSRKSQEPSQQQGQ